MSKLSETLRKMKVYNVHDLLLQFGNEKEGVAVVYQRPPEGRLGWCETTRTEVWSPFFLVDPNSKKWGKEGTKEFHGNRSQSMPHALAWAEQKFKISKWATAPMDRNCKVPEAVVLRATHAAERFSLTAAKHQKIPARTTPVR